VLGNLLVMAGKLFLLSQQRPNGGQIFIHLLRRARLKSPMADAWRLTFMYCARLLFQAIG
jgi:hypothetical protein